MNNKQNTTNQFPEKWAINLFPEVKKWIQTEFNSTFYEGDPESHIFSFPNWENGNGFESGSHTSRVINEDYTQITLEQFKKHILKINTDPIQNKETICVKKQLQAILDESDRLWNEGKDKSFIIGYMEGYIKSIIREIE